jgi:hypothetical protein
MQGVEDFDQINEGNNEKGRKETSPCSHTTFRQGIEKQSSTCNSCIQACQADNFFYM